MNVFAYILDSDEFERLATGNSDYNQTSYKQFMDWNIQCFNELKKNDQLWIANLCTRLGTNSMRLVDMESCVAMTASNFYFDLKKRICIASPR